MAKLETGTAEPATDTGSGNDLATAQASIREEEGTGNAAEVTERLQRAAADVLEPADTAPAQSAAPSPEPAQEGAQEAAPAKRKGGWPKGKPRNSSKAPKVAAKPAAPIRKPTPKEDRSFQAPATMAARIEAAERRAADLETQLAGRSSVSEEEISDLRYEIEGLIITAQAVGRQRFGEVAILTEEQTLAITRMWTRPFERALRYLAKRTDDGRVPAWVMPAVQLALAMVGTIAVLFPNWMAFVDKQQAAGKLNAAPFVPHTDEPAPGSAVPATHEIGTMDDLEEMHFPEFVRPRGAES